MSAAAPFQRISASLARFDDYKKIREQPVLTYLPRYDCNDCPRAARCYNSGVE